MYKLRFNKFLFSMVQQPTVGQDLIIMEASQSHSGTPHSVILLWKSDRPFAETSISQHSQQTDIHAAGGIRTRSPTKRAAADPHLKPRGHWDWQLASMYQIKFARQSNNTTSKKHFAKMYYLFK
jgi:hypothetical protein